jgi:hypothetical protein
MPHSFQSEFRRYERTIKISKACDVMRHATHSLRLRLFGHVLFGAVVFALSACATEPLDYLLPEPDLSLDPAALAQPRLMYACGTWLYGDKPTEAKVFVDVSFDRRLQSDVYDHPTSRHIAAVERHGGKIVYKFHFPAARVWIATDSIPALASEVPVRGVLRIADLRRYDWNAGVGYIKPYTYQEGITRYVELGGKVDFVFNTINGISGLIPDRSIGALRSDPRVAYVESGAPYANPECF